MALAEFEKLCERFEKKYPAYIKTLLDKKEQYFAFMKYPEPIRKHIYTTNAVENLNSRLEVLRINSGGYFQSIRLTDVAIYVTVERMQKNKWNKPLTAFREVLYEMKQMFNTRFMQQTQFS